MKTKVTFKALRCGKVVYKTIPIEHEFKVIPPCVLMGHEFPETSIESQVIEHLDSIDKSDLMVKYDFDIIIDYWVKYEKPKRNEVKEFEEFCEPLFAEMPDLRRQLSAVCYEMQDTLFGRGKSHATKLKEAVKTLEFSYKVSNAILDELNKVFTSNHNKAIAYESK
jgi:hypothetical protein